MKTEELKNTTTAGEFAEYLENEKALKAMKQLQEKGSVLIKRELRIDERLQARTFALREARSLHPDKVYDSRNQSYMQSGIHAAHATPPNIDEVLKTADKIFNWLTA